MSDDDDDDLFADSGGDTDDLIAEASKNKKDAKPPIAKPKKLKKKKAAPKKRKRAEKIPDADNDSDDEPGLFDSDDDDDDEPKKPMSKRERMEALTKKKRKETAASKKASGKSDGNESDGSANSADFVRTKADDDFIDSDDDDPDAKNELYAEQHFDADEAEEFEERPKKKGKGGGSSSYKPKEKSEFDGHKEDKDNPVNQAIERMKKKSKKSRNHTEVMEQDARPFLARMDEAADDDDEAFEQKRPALKKLKMINEVCEKLASREMMKPLLEIGLLNVCKRWVQPLPNGKLGNVTVRQRLLQSIGLMNIEKYDLQTSGFGKVVMSLYMHRDETPAMKRQLRGLIDKWSRPIFQKSGDLRDLERFQQSRGVTGGISAIARMNQAGQAGNNYNDTLNQKSSSRGGKDQDLNSLIKSGSLGKTQSGINRVRIPFSRGFNYSARPADKNMDVRDKRRQGGGPESRQALSKRILDKKRPKGKNQRSANISIEGRATKP